MFLFVYAYLLVCLFPEQMIAHKKSKDCRKKEETLSLQPLLHYAQEYEENKKNLPKPVETVTEQSDTEEQSKSSTTYKPCTRCGSLGFDMFDEIIHGRKAPAKEFPWQVQVQTAKITCGGVLLSSEWVLTAAHCLAKLSIVILGTTSRLPNGGITRGVIKEIKHEGWDGFHNDIGLVKMNYPVDFSEYILPACLPMEDSKFYGCNITGWGYINFKKKKYPKTLQVGKVRIMNQKECARRYWYANKMTITGGQVCTDMSSDIKSSICNGDSGGPLNCKFNNIYYVVGLVSFVQTGCLRTIVPNVFTRVSYYKEWIEDTINNN